jgi:hypothetical protein
MRWKRCLLVLLGLVLIGVSFLQAFLERGSASIRLLGLSYLFFLIGFILLFEVVTWSIYKNSLLKTILSSRRNIILFILVSFVGGLILEVVAHWMGKLWIYPYGNFILYAIFIVPLFIFYWLSIGESYLAIKAIIDYFHKGKIIVSKPFRRERVFFIFIGVVGIILIFLSAFLIYTDYSAQTAAFVVTEDINQQTSSYIVNFGHIMLIFFGLWFSLEFLEHLLKKPSLLKSTIHRNFIPAVAIIVSSFLFAVAMEYQNIFHELWQYFNFPLEGVTILGLPLTLYVAWILHYIFFLSLFRLMTDRESEEIWKGDLVR